MAQNKYIDELYRKDRTFYSLSDYFNYYANKGSLSLSIFASKRDAISSVKYSANSDSSNILATSSRQKYIFETSTGTDSSLIFYITNNDKGKLDVSDFKSRPFNPGSQYSQKFYINFSFTSDVERRNLTKMVACASTSSTNINTYISWNDCHAAIGVFEDVKDADKSVFIPTLINNIFGDLQLHLWPKSEETKGLVFGGQDTSGDFAKTADMLKITKGYNIYEYGGNLSQESTSYKGFVKIYLRENHLDYELGLLVLFADLTTNYNISGTLLAPPDFLIIYNISDNSEKLAYQNNVTHLFADNTQYKSHATVSVLECNRSIVLPTSIDFINASAFLHNDDSNDNCELITKISFPRYTKAIGEYAFKNCINLKNILYHKPNGQTPELVGTGLPPEITRIEKETFYGCTSLNNLSISSNINYIGKLAFYKCKNTKFTFLNSGSGALNIDSSAFSEIGQITLQFPDRIKTIGEESFSNNTHLITISIPYGSKGTISLGNSAFKGCTTLSTVSIGLSNNIANIETISELCFAECSKLRNINGDANVSANIPEGIKTIKANAFNPYPDSNGISNNMFKSVSLPTSLDRTGENIFSNNAVLDTVIWNPKWCGEDTTNNYNYTKKFNAPFYSVKNQIKSVAFGNLVQYIPNYLCCEMNNSNFTSVSIPASVIEIGNWAFFSDTNLLSVSYINPNNTSPELTICEGAFEDCSLLNVISLPDRCVSIGERAFYRCKNALALSFNDCNLTSPSLTIGTESFKECNNLDTVNIPNRCTIIQQKAFESDGLLEDLDFTTIDLQDSSKNLSILYGAFRNCVKINSINLPDRCSYIGNLAFYNCNLSNSINFGHTTSTTSFSETDKNIKLNRIGEEAFAYCGSSNSVNDSSVIIPYNVTHIEQGAFKGCSNLKTVYWKAKNAQTDTTPRHHIIYTDSTVSQRSIYESKCVKIKNGIKNNDIGEEIASFFEWQDGTPLRYNGRIDSEYYSIFDDITVSTTSTESNTNSRYHNSSVNRIEFLNGTEVVPSEVAINLLSLQSIKVEGTVNTISEKAFSMCRNLRLDKSYMSLSEGLRTIENEAFSHANKFSGEHHVLCIPHTVTNISEKVFYDSTWNVNSLILGCCLTHIGKNAFNLEGRAAIGEATDITCVTSYSLVPPDLDMAGLVNPFYDSLWGSYKAELFILGPENPNLQEEYRNCTEMYKYYDKYGWKSFNTITSLKNYLIAVNGLRYYRSKIYGKGDKSTGVHNEINVQGDYILSAGNCTSGEYPIQDDAEFGGFWYYDENKPVGQSYDVGSPVISSSINNIPVIGIGDEALRGCAMTTISIPNSIRFIGPRAFLGCWNLQTVSFNVDSTLKIINQLAFAYCKKLSSISIPDSVIYIDDFSFAKCSLLLTVNIGKNTTDISELAFFNTPIRTFSVNLGNSTYEAKSDGLYKGNKLLFVTTTSSEYTLNSSIFSNYILSTCLNITKLIFNVKPANLNDNDVWLYNIDNVRTIEFKNADYLFEIRKLIKSYNKQLNYKVRKNNGTGPWIYVSFLYLYDINNITLIILPNGVLPNGKYGEIPDNFCYEFRGITSINIPTGYSKIGVCAFKNCNNIKTITINSYTSFNNELKIGNEAFCGITSLENVYCYFSVPPVLGNNVFASTPDTWILHVPEGTKAEYIKNEYNWNIPELRIIDDIQI